MSARQDHNSIFLNINKQTVCLKIRKKDPYLSEQANHSCYSTSNINHCIVGIRLSFIKPD